MCHWNAAPDWSPGGTGRRHKKPVVIDPATQAEIDAEIAANERTASVRRRRRASTLFGAGNRVLGTAAVTGAPGATALGGGGGGGRGVLGGGGSGGRGGYQAR